MDRGAALLLTLATGALIALSRCPTLCWLATPETLGAATDELGLLGVTVRGRLHVASPDGVAHRRDGSRYYAIRRKRYCVSQSTTAVMIGTASTHAARPKGPDPGGITGPIV
jgi:hypothetical protein